MTARNETVTIGRGAVRTLVLVVAAWQCGVAADGHGGRRFQVGIENGKLIAQGVITTGVDDGGGVVRPYTNVLHDHWSNSPLIGFEKASSTLPGFDVLGPAPSELWFQSLSLELKSASQWLAPPVMVGNGTMPSLVPLGGDEELSMTLGGQSVFPGDGQSLLLDSSINPGGSLDIDPLYSINETPVDKLIVLELELTTSAPGVFPSDPIYVVLSPDGESPAARLHHTSLFLENWLASRNIPEPNTTALVVVCATLSNWCFRLRSQTTRSDQTRNSSPSPQPISDSDSAIASSPDVCVAATLSDSRQETTRLENEAVRVVIEPRFGGKVTSLYDKRCAIVPTNAPDDDLGRRDDRGGRVVALGAIRGGVTRATGTSPVIGS